jgi:outer membrane receptor protein involved in Fe transport
MTPKALVLTALGCALSAGFLYAAGEPASAAAPDQTPAGQGPTEHVQVTATKIPESTDTLPASLTVITRDDLIRRGARDLTSALALVAGVSVAPGSDGGPAGSVPEFWGLREFDAFLLTVDGVPWGGAFAPALPTLDLRNVDRIEVLRGSAPVMYGAASFVGVINVIRRSPGEGGTDVRVAGGSYGSGSANVETGLPEAGGLKSSLTAEAVTTGYADDRAGVDRGLFHWQGVLPAGTGLWRFHAGAINQKQDPASPRPRDGATLSPLVPIDSNHNPGGSHLDEKRYTADGSYEHPIGKADWTTTLSTITSHQDILRGFLTDITLPVDNANGFRQTINTTDIYFDSHVSQTPATNLKVVYGLDYLYGGGHADGGDFDYTVGLDGSGFPEGDDIPSAADIGISNHRNFGGLYGQAFWTPAPRWHFELGLRANHTQESRRIDAVEFGSPLETSTDEVSRWRGGGTAGVTWTAWEQDRESVRLFADYRNTYKPAVNDFGLDGETEILAPETGESYELGVKNRLAGGRLEIELSAFQMDLKNIVVSQSVGGLPALENAGAERLRGVELGTSVAFKHDLFWRVNYSLHDARFEDYLTEFGGVPTQLAGNQLEMSARNMASTGINYGRATGWQAWAQANYVGDRFLNKRNTAVAQSYVTWDAGAAYRFAQAWEVRVDGYNLNDRRDPVSESELGDAQYYLMLPRSIVVGLRWTAGH